ncbi:fibronectin type III domain-containing protein [Salinibacterium sp. SWN139]|uniref:fibronectin type III domain-containing protein n=1 Tax=Salinibacterium sp. SWN139 TaxID=2792055 RepID=UPI0018CFCD47|nr:fibronectin type III domain-containing protein [Salinibacterium sp. SWN139]MBH0054489.1 fibronectin type III domain-containing protein [Salinibacterium sp. SWN139]
MTDVGFGGNVGSANNGEGTWVRSSLSLPSGRKMANGSTACLVTHVGAYVGGYFGTMSIKLQLGSSGTSYFNVASDSPPVAFTGYKSISNVLVNGGSTWFYAIHNSGRIYFGRSSTSGANGVFNGNGFGWSGTLGGALRYIEAPSAPRNLTVVSSVAGQATVDYDAPSDDGGSSVNGYVIQYSTSSSFTGASKIEVSSGTTSKTITGLLPGRKYYFRVGAQNAVTDAAGTWGVTSSAVNTLVLSGAKYGVDGVWKDCEVYVGINGEWVPVSVSFGSGGQWEPME